MRVANLKKNRVDSNSDPIKSQVAPSKLLFRVQIKRPIVVHMYFLFSVPSYPLLYYNRVELGNGARRVGLARSSKRMNDKLVL